MNIACIYTVERGVSREKPLTFAIDIPFGIAIIATLLKGAGHDVELFVFSQQSLYEELLRTYIAKHRPKLFCLTAVSTQFPFICKIAQVVKKIDPTIFVILGGHHASLDSENAIKTPTIDAICIGEGESSIIELARRIDNSEPITRIPNLWIKQSNGGVEKNPTLPFRQDLDSLPYIDRKMWEPWINEPERNPSIALGRGCPFRCAYCSNHAMQRLSSGPFIRFRSPENIIGEIEHIRKLYPDVNSIYLEVETIAHQKKAFPLFEKLAEFNKNLKKRLSFGLNFSVTYTFIRKKKWCIDFFEMLKRANVVYLNVGFESGSEKLRREVLRRPQHTNEEFIRFSRIAKEYNIDLNLYILIGVPGETLKDYRETLQVVRQVLPKLVFLSIYYPYHGTDLYNIALEQGLITMEYVDPRAERARAALNLPGFSKSRVRLEYVLFWFKVYRGYWPVSKILAYTVKGIINGSPAMWSTYLFFKERSSIYKFFRNMYRSMIKKYDEGERQKNTC